MAEQKITGTRFPLLILYLIQTLCSTALAVENCRYSSYQWNTLTKKAEAAVTVNKPYTELLPEEIDTLTGCSVCSEDQRWIKIAGLQPIRLCKVIANEIESILNHVIARGFIITDLIGYRVGRTRGEVDAHGMRTGFSNHSFGIAIDINPDSNGLYENCLEYSEHCVLRRGGEWRPGENSQSITGDSLLVDLMKNSGFKWGGEITGRQKDFMHFSVSGY